MLHMMVILLRLPQLNWLCRFTQHHTGGRSAYLELTRTQGKQLILQKSITSVTHQS